jgi:Rieske Fe-S protein
VKETNISRRSALCGVLALALGLVADFFPEAAQAAAGITQLKNGKIQVTLSANKALAKVGGAVILNLNDGSQIAVVRSSADSKGFSAVSLTCPHNFATVNEVGGKWVCPAHGSNFALNGKFISSQVPGFRKNLNPIPVAATATTLTIG